MFSFTAFSGEPFYPDLTPEYLQTFDPGISRIIETSQESNIVKVYDAKGKFLFTVDKNGETDQLKIIRLVNEKAKSLGIND
jgi:hypothetical protein